MQLGKTLLVRLTRLTHAGWHPAARIRPAEAGTHHFDILGGRGEPFVFACVAAPRTEEAVRRRLAASTTVTTAVITDGTPEGTRFLQRLLCLGSIHRCTCRLTH